VRTAFAQKRKTLANNMRAGLPPAAVAAALAEAAINPMARAEALSIESFAALWRSLQTKNA